MSEGLKDAKEKLLSQLSSSEISVEPKQETPKTQDEFEEAMNFGKSGHAIPYSRFQQVNDEKKELKNKLDELTSQFSSKLETERMRIQEQLLTEIGLRGETADLEDVGPKVVDKRLEVLQRKIEALESDRFQSRIDQDIKRLTEIYPQADELTLRAYRQIKPSGDLEEFAKFQHEAINNKVEGRYKEYVESKKKEAMKRVPHQDTSGRFHMPSNIDEKPKTLKQAGDLVKKFLMQS